MQERGNGRKERIYIFLKQRNKTCEGGRYEKKKKKKRGGGKRVDKNGRGGKR